MRNTKKTLLTSTAVLSALLLAGCGADSTNETAPATPSAVASASTSASTSPSAAESSSPSQSASESASAAASSSSPSSEASGTPAQGVVDLSDHTFPVSWKDAHKKASDNFDGKVSKIELEPSDNGKYHYKVELRSETQKYAIQIDANNGDVISEKTETDDDAARKYQEKTVNLDDVVGLDEAMDAAQKAQPGRVDEWKLEGDDKSGPQYEFDITDTSSTEDYEVKVDAKTGKVTEVDD